MKPLLSSLRASALLTVVFAVLLCGAYPAFVWAAGQALFPFRANGSLLRDRTGVVRGSALLAQSFTGPGYLHPRPSAAGTGYDPLNSGGTNLGPTSQKLAASVQAAVASYRAENALAEADAVPADAVTASGSGLDPHVSLANAALQAPRIARARGMTLGAVRSVIARHVEGRDLGFLGEPGVNVLLVNAELDHAGGAAP